MNNCDAVFDNENKERQVAVVKNRLKTEIGVWLESLSLQLTKVGKELLEEAEKKLDDAIAEAKKGDTCLEDILEIVFVPRPLSSVGYLCHGSVLPSCLTLVLSTALTEVKVGARIVLDVEGPTSKVKDQVLVSVRYPQSTKEETCQCQGKNLQYSIVLPCEGLYTVTATLYKENIEGSPLIIPVFTDPSKVLGQIGISAAGNEGAVPAVDTRGQGQKVVAPPATAVPVPSKLTLPVEYVMGTMCLAKWGKDGIWYNAKIDKDCRERGVEVTFMNYNNSDFVKRENIVFSEEELPEGALVDGGVDQLVAGDLVVAKWQEDGVWYNAEILRKELGRYLVLFIDYGNEALVEAQEVLLDVLDIPEREVLDMNVEVLREAVLDSMDGVGVEATCRVQKWSVGNDCLARWLQDGKWYNAIVDEVILNSAESPAEEYLVTFTDYGNSEIVTVEDLAVNVDEIPVEERLLDENVVSSDSGKREPSPKPQFLKAEHDTYYTRKETEVNVPQEFKTRFTATNDEEHNTNVIETNRKVLKKGAKVTVKKGEDNTWHKAVIHEVIAPDKLYIVRYEGNGQYGGAPPEDVVLGWGNQEFMKDACTQQVENEEVDLKWNVGDQCIARWSVDNVWYNAKIVGVGHGNIIVKFVDYGNEDNVIPEHVLKTVDEIPPHSFIDENVDKVGKNYQVKSEVILSNKVTSPRDDISEFKNKPTEKAPRPLRPGSHVQAKILAKAVSAATGSCLGGTRETKQFIISDKDSEQKLAIKTREAERCSVNAGVKERTDPRIDGQKNYRNVKVERGVLPDAPCVVKCSEDGVWYNGMVTEVYGDGTALVYFVDYGNSERVKGENIVRGPDHIPLGERVDSHVHGVAAGEEGVKNISFLSLCRMKDGMSSLACKEIMTIHDLQGPVGVTILPDKSMVVACKDANCVSRYNINGEFLGYLQPGREFVKPSDILSLSSGELVVRDERGLQLFGTQLKFVKCVAEKWIDHCFGLAEDDEGKIVTINHNPSSEDSTTKITAPNTTDVFFIDKISDRVLKRIEMVDLIIDAAESLQNQSLQPEMSFCKSLAFRNKKLYVVDHGLDCIFILSKDGTESEMFGRRGNNGGEFRDPAGLVVDDDGTMMVVDSRNHRLQLIDDKLWFAGMVEVDPPLARPSGIFVEGMDILVTNYQGKSVVRYKIVD